jgi:osmotically-inducible protein OsmY
MKQFVLVFLLLPLIVACGTLRERQVTPLPREEAIEAQIRTKLKNDLLTAPWEIRVRVEGDRVTLTGLVDQEEERRRAEDLARSVVGELRKINNEMMLTEEVILDDSIVAKLKNDLVTDPITRAGNIEVRSHKGVVTLQGTVKTEEQKRQAETLAQNIIGVSRVENNLKVSG